MKSNPVRLLLATIACLVLQTVAIRAEEKADAKPEEVTYLVTLKRAALSGQTISESSIYVSSEEGEFSGTIPADLNIQLKPSFIIKFDAGVKTISFELMDTSLIRQTINEGRSYTFPMTIFETHVSRKKSDVYTLLGTDKEKLTISFKKLDPKELDEVPVAKEAEGKK